MYVSVCVMLTFGPTLSFYFALSSRLFLQEKFMQGEIFCGFVKKGKNGEFVGVNF